MDFKITWCKECRERTILGERVSVKGIPPRLRCEHSRRKTEILSADKYEWDDD